MVVGVMLSLDDLADEQNRKTRSGHFIGNYYYYYYSFSSSKCLISVPSFIESAESLIIPAFPMSNEGPVFLRRVPISKDWQSPLSVAMRPSSTIIIHLLVVEEGGLKALRHPLRTGRHLRPYAKVVCDTV